MATTITIGDESVGGSTYTMTLSVPSESITVRELIRARVYQEVAEYNDRQPSEFRLLVQPTDSEQTLNGFRMRKTRKVNRIDPDEQFDRAVQAFQGNGVILLIDNKQAESLEQRVRLTSETRVTFLRLVPLVGG
jgi:hypothetical protein